MFRLFSVLMVVALLSGCGPRKLSPADIASEKQAIESLVNDFWKAYATKDLAATTKVFSITASGAVTEAACPTS